MTEENEKSDSDQMFWSDRIAQLVTERDGYNYIDKKIEKPEVYGIKSSTSISGVPHIGNASDVIRSDSVVRSLRDLGENVKFIWVAEDMDPLRKVPAGIPDKFEKYLGMPVSDLPCPVGCCESYVKHFVRLFIESLHEYFGTEPKMLTTTDAYKSGEFYPYVKKAIEKIDVIKEVLNKHRTIPLSKIWSPWKPVCDNCGKIITTKVIDVNGDIVKYKCGDYSFKEFGKKAYNKVEGCGHVGESDIKEGRGKLLWKIEWAAEWPLWNIHFEPAGKEHFMPGASFWNAGEIAERVYDWPEPYPGRNEIQPYEYIMINGEKMSASKGNVVATWEWPEFAPPEILRLILLKRPNMQREFSYSKIPVLVDEFDRLRDVYYGKESVDNNRELMNLKRLYEMSLTKEDKGYISNIPFGFASMIAQIIPDATKSNFDKVLSLAERTNHIKDVDELSDVARKNIARRIKQAGSWVEKYGTSRDKITISKEIPDKVDELSDEQRSSLIELGEYLSKDRTNDDIWDKIRKIAKSNGISAKKVFQATYIALLGQRYGPRLVPFIQTMDTDFIVDRFKLEK